MNKNKLENIAGNVNLPKETHLILISGKNVVNNNRVYNILEGFWDIYRLKVSNDIKPGTYYDTNIADIPINVKPFKCVNLYLGKDKPKGEDLLKRALDKAKPILKKHLPRGYKVEEDEIVAAIEAEIYDRKAREKKE